MKNLIQDIKNVSPDYRVMLIMVLFMKAGQFMILPFLAIFLASQGRFSPTAIGLVVGSGPFIYALAGVFAGVFSDRFSPKTTMIVAQIVGGFSIFFFFSFATYGWYFLSNVLTGLSRAFFDIGSKAYKINGLSLHQRRIRFSLRYMVINSAAALGPVFGAYFAATHSYASFKIIGVLYVVLALSCIFLLHDSEHRILQKQSGKKINLFDSLRLLLCHRQLQMLCLIGFIFWTTYSQLDSTLPLYLHAKLANGVRIYSWMLVTNAAGCALLPLFLVHMTKNIPLVRQGILGMSLFAVSFVIMSFALQASILIGAMMILVVGESIIMPLNDLIMSTISPTNQAGMYYGAMSFSNLGLGVGPMLGGLLYEHFGLPLVLGLGAILCLLTILIYQKLGKQIA